MVQRQRESDCQNSNRPKRLIRRLRPRKRALAGFDGLLYDLRRLADAADTVSIEEILTTIGARGHGPIILTLAGLMMLPTGMLPLMPSLIGGLLALTAIEMIVGGKGVSLPKRIARIRLGSEGLKKAVARAAPICAWLGRVVHPRWPGFVSGSFVLTLIAIALLIAAPAMILIGAIPGLPFVLCIPALLFGLGLTAGDGVLVGLGFLATIGAMVLGFQLVNRVFGIWPII